MEPISSTFTVGHCYYNSKAEDESPKVMRCKKSIIYGMQLVPYSGLLKFPISCDSEEVRSGTSGGLHRAGETVRSYPLTAMAAPLIPYHKGPCGELW